MPAANLFLIRHAESEWNAIGRWQGQANPDLSERGVAQAQQLAEQFPLERIDLLVCSDLNRAASTAEPLERRYGVRREIDQRLRELDVGSWSGRTRAEINETEPGKLDLWFQGQRGWDGGETYEEHELRCDQFADSMLGLDSDTIVVVSHGGTIRALVLSLLGLDHSQRWRFAGIDHCSMTHVQMSRYGYRLVSYNEPVIDSANHPALPAG